MKGRTFFDTSVLVPALIDMGEPSEPAQALMDLVAQKELVPVSTAWHCCLETWSVTTRLPGELRLQAADALRLIEHEILARFEVLQLAADHQAGLLQTAAKYRIAGGRIYDSHIAEIAWRGGVDVVVTENRRDFLTLLDRGVRVLESRELLHELGI